MDGYTYRCQRWLGTGVNSKTTKRFRWWRGLFKYSRDGCEFRCNALHEQKLRPKYAKVQRTSQRTFGRCKSFFKIGLSFFSNFSQTFRDILLFNITISIKLGIGIIEKEIRENHEPIIFRITLPRNSCFNEQLNIHWISSHSLVSHFLTSRTVKILSLLSRIS